MPTLGCLNSHENTGVRQSWILKFENGTYMNIGIWYFNWLIRDSHIWESHIWELDRTRLYETAVCCRTKVLVVIGQATGLCWKNGLPPWKKTMLRVQHFQGHSCIENHEKSCIIINLNWMNYVLSSREELNIYTLIHNNVVLLAHVYDVYVNIRYHLTRFAFMLPLEALVGGQSCLQSSSL